MSEPSRVLKPVAEYYSNRVRQHGAQPAGVDWNSPEAQEVRWAQFLSLFEGEEHFSLIDFGCGYGGMHGYLKSQGVAHTYTGFDIASDQIREASRLHGSDADCNFVSDASALREADYVVASGVFHVKLEASDEDWEAMVQSTLQTMARLSRKGFGFNMRTSYTDPDHKWEHIYYGDPAEYVRTCLDTFSRRVVLKHDYGLYDFTILVRTEG